MVQLKSKDKLLDTSPLPSFLSVKSHSPFYSCFGLDLSMNSQLIIGGLLEANAILILLFK
jgi:hypothetical protein